MDYEQRKVDILLNIKKIGELIAGSAEYQLSIDECYEDTFRDLIMDIEHQLDRFYEEEDDNDND